jgi:uncharacterized protein YbaR (Trm112 family)
MKIETEGTLFEMLDHWTIESIEDMVEEMEAQVLRVKQNKHLLMLEFESCFRVCGLCKRVYRIDDDVPINMCNRCLSY